MHSLQNISFPPKISLPLGMSQLVHNIILVYMPVCQCDRHTSMTPVLVVLGQTSQAAWMKPSCPGFQLIVMS